MSIPLLDLKLQHASIKEEILTAINKVLEAGNYILGPNVRALEEEIAAYCGTEYGIGVANGTDALLLALEAYGIGPEMKSSRLHSLFLPLQKVFLGWVRYLCLLILTLKLTTLMWAKLKRKSLQKQRLSFPCIFLDKWLTWIPSWL